jgi:glycerol-3-phosphate acyltransferase PlsY
MEIALMVICFVAAYVIGAVPFAYIAGKALKGVDIRDYGSGNVGATNVLRTLGKGPGIAVLLLDMAKGTVAVTLVPLAFLRVNGADFPVSDELLRAICGVVAIVGHIWTVFLRFRGGKGVATTVGVFFGLTWVSMLISIGVFVVVVYLTRYISLGSILLGVSLLVANLLLRSPVEYVILSGAVLLLVIYTHGSNIRRLMRGTENKLGKKAQIAREGVK